MANFQSSFGYTDKLGTTKQLVVPQLSYGSDYSVKSETASEVVLTNTTSPLDQPELIRTAYNPIKDIYKNSTIDPAARSTAKQGISLLKQSIATLRVTPTASDACGCGLGYLDFPILMHSVLQVPLSPYVTIDNIGTVLFRHFAEFFGSGADVTLDYLNAMLRGSIKPSDL